MTTKNPEPSSNDGADDGADPGGVTPSHDIPPFRESGSGASYSPDGNWGAERQSGTSAGEVAERVLGEVDGLGATGSGATMAGAPTDAGDGGFGPEGGYTADAEAGNQPRTQPGRDSEEAAAEEHGK